MKKSTLLYIPLLILFALGLSVLVVHYGNIGKRINYGTLSAQLPFTSGTVVVETPETQNAGLKLGDRFVALNGKSLDTDEIYYEELVKLRADEPANLTITRKTGDEKTEQLQIALTPKRVEKDFNYYSSLVAMFLYSYFLPTFCMLLGFWVVMARPRDGLAWLLLFMLLGISNIAFENYPNHTLIGFYRTIFFNTWALSMLLFGIYFPERWNVDRRFPWVKWILIVPLAFQTILGLLEQAKIQLGFNAFGSLKPLAKFYSNIGMPINMVAMSLFFIALGVAGVFLIRLLAEKIKAWTDRKFFREAYNSEQILADLSEDVRTMIETKPLLETVSNKISESLHVPQVALLLKNGSNFQPAYALGFEHQPSASFSKNALTIEKLKKNEPLTVYRDDEESWINNEPNLDGERANLKKLNSQLLLPFGAKEKLSGFLSLSAKLSESPYTPTDLRFLKSVAAQTGLALENSRLTEAIVSEAAQRERFNTEIEIAREVQERLFPQELPPIAGLDYFGAYRPALAVGGDYYDFLELPQNKFGIAIGDISGKGIGASLMMASLQASLRGQAIHFKSDLAGLMKQINSLVYEVSTSNRYATFFFAQYEPSTGKLVYVNAGHNPLVVVRRKDEGFEVLRLEEGGAVVGMLPSMLVNYKQGEIELRKGDLLVGFTDGISEAMNPAEEEWSEEQMIEAIKAQFDLPAAEMLPYLVKCADDFASGAKQHDDMTLIIVRVI